MKPIRVLLSLLMTVATLLASALSIKAIGFEAEKVYESIFVIYSGNSLGSGFALGENCIITNAHVIENSTQIMIVSYEGDEYEAAVLGINEYEDIAVLAVKDSSFPYLTVGDVSAMKTGDDVCAIGAPKGMPYTLTKGSISAKERMIGNNSYIQIDAAINEGNSGGPLLNDSGQVLGMNTLKMSDSEGIGLAIPIEKICKYIESLGIELSENGNVRNRIEVAEHVEEPEIPDEEEKKEQLSSVTVAAIAIAVISVICNIILCMMLMHQKRKNIVPQYDPRERTDFEIDIWE